ncbi:MAG: hypothetical protein K0R55_3473 [Sporomusa sp.]|jgi:hypothetical protein|nr:hypothetical protein [Sporomusa sp.]
MYIPKWPSGEEIFINYKENVLSIQESIST